MITDGHPLTLYYFAEDPDWLTLDIPPEFDVPNGRHWVVQDEDGWSTDQHFVALLDYILTRISPY